MNEVHNEARQEHSHYSGDGRKVIVKEFNNVPYLEGKHDTDSEYICDTDTEKPTIRIYTHPTLIILILFMIWIYFLWSLDHCGEIIVLSSIGMRSLSPLTYRDFLLCSCRSITLRSAISSSRAQDFSFGL